MLVTLNILLLFCLEYIQTIKLPAKSTTDKYTDDTATISGWGKDFDGKFIS